MIPWLSANFKHFKPNAAIALNATRHMNKIERKKLFSPEHRTDADCGRQVV